MAGKTDLGELLSSLAPVLHPGEFVFASLPGTTWGDRTDLEPIAAVAEPEGLTLVVPRERAAAAGLPFDGLFRMITLSVHSSLEAVGLTAAVAAALTSQAISANVVAGYYHDHIFVPAGQAQAAIAALTRLSGSEPPVSSGREGDESC